jgi:tRNA-Thr(GGU) m(6)t(6)A37 methyltransferase TsaA
MRFEVQPVGRVESSITDVEDAPRQGDEGAPGAVLVFDERVAEAMGDLRAGDEILVLSWLHRARRDVLSVHPRGDERRPVQGVFSTRSPDRPNPIGLHRVRVLSVDGTRVTVSGLEAVNGTPVVDVKPVLEPIAER